MSPLPSSSLEALAAQALAAFKRGDLAKCEERCEQVSALVPASTFATALLGAIYLARSEHKKAATIFSELTAREPKNAAHWMNLGTARRGEGHLDAALMAYATGAQIGGVSADFYYNVGLTHLQRFDYESARETLRHAIELAPRDAEIRFQYARACYESMQPQQALDALRDWQHLEGLQDNLVADIGHTLMDLGESTAANATLERLSQFDKLDARAKLTLAQIFERTNRVEEARALVEALMASNADPTIAVELQLTAAHLAQREGQHIESVDLFEKALTNCTDFHQAHVTLFSLAKSLDALGRYSEAFAKLADAHRSQVEHFAITAPVVSAHGAPTLAIIRRSTHRDDIATWNGNAPSLEESPTFVVAFPRSGTTLLEMTLDAHPKLKSMDEQPFLHQALDDILNTGHEYPEQLGKISESQLLKIRERYWRRARTKVALTESQRLVDKNPLNLLRLPVIKRLFPNAPIILAIRHPADVLISCYMQHFRAPDFALLCTDLTTLANAYRRSFDFWYEQAELLTPFVREVRYETLVSNFEAEVAALCEFLHLPFDAAMLQPARNAQGKGYISTPSYAQVIQPVNKRSVDRWRNYEEHLMPVAPILRPYLERWNYVMDVGSSNSK